MICKYLLHSLGCLFALLMVSFGAQKFFILMTPVAFLCYSWWAKLLWTLNPRTIAVFSCPVCRDHIPEKHKDNTTDIGHPLLSLTSFQKDILLGNKAGLKTQMTPTPRNAMQPLKSRCRSTARQTVSKAESKYQGTEQEQDTNLFLISANWGIIWHNKTCKS